MSTIGVPSPSPDDNISKGLGRLDNKLFNYTIRGLGKGLSQNDIDDLSQKVTDLFQKTLQADENLGDITSFKIKLKKVKGNNSEVREIKPILVHYTLKKGPSATETKEQNLQTAGGDLREKAADVASVALRILQKGIPSSSTHNLPPPQLTDLITPNIADNSQITPIQPNIHPLPEQENNLGSPSPESEDSGRSSSASINGEERSGSISSRLSSSFSNSETADSRLNDIHVGGNETPPSLSNEVAQNLPADIRRISPIRPNSRSFENSNFKPIQVEDSDLKNTTFRPDTPKPARPSAFTTHRHTPESANLETIEERSNSRASNDSEHSLSSIDSTRTTPDKEEQPVDESTPESSTRSRSDSSISIEGSMEDDFYNFQVSDRASVPTLNFHPVLNDPFLQTDDASLTKNQFQMGFEIRDSNHVMADYFSPLIPVDIDVSARPLVGMKNGKFNCFMISSLRILYSQEELRNALAMKCEEITSSSASDSNPLLESLHPSDDFKLIDDMEKESIINEYTNNEKSKKGFFTNLFYSIDKTPIENKIEAYNEKVRQEKAKNEELKSYLDKGPLENIRDHGSALSSGGNALENATLKEIYARMSLKDAANIILSSLSRFEAQEEQTIRETQILRCAFVKLISANHPPLNDETFTIFGSITKNIPRVSAYGLLLGDEETTKSGLLAYKSQEDPSEFINELLNVIDANNAKLTPYNSIRTQTTTTAGTSESRNENTHILIVPSPEDDIEDSFQKFVSSQIETGSVLSNQGTKITSEKYSDFGDAVMLQLNSLYRYVPELKLTRGELDPITIEGNNYEIDSIVMRVGNDAVAGHYYTYKKIDGKWYKCDDSKVSPCQLSNDGGFSITEKWNESRELIAPLKPYLLHLRKIEST